MILIADSGSTKTDWALVNGRQVVKEFTTKGINPVILSAEDIDARLRSELLPHIEGFGIKKIWFYGAGCRTEYSGIVEECMMRITNCASVFVASDMLGAARALCGHQPGVACILGTGSNSCLYDGFLINDNVPPLGYVLGDEGSGNAFGRRLLNGIFKRQLSEKLCVEFFLATSLTYEEVIRRVYSGSEPGRFLASFVPFILEHISDTQIQELVTQEFTLFVERNLLSYDNVERLPINFTGSVARLFWPLLMSVLESYNLIPGRVIARPLSGLVAYHQTCE